MGPDSLQTGNTREGNWDKTMIWRAILFPHCEMWWMQGLVCKEERGGVCCWYGPWWTDGVGHRKNQKTKGGVTWCRFADRCELQRSAQAAAQVEKPSLCYADDNQSVMPQSMGCVPAHWKAGPNPESLSSGGPHLLAVSPLQRHGHRADLSHHTLTSLSSSVST